MSDGVVIKTEPEDVDTPGSKTLGRNHDITPTGGNDIAHVDEGDEAMEAGFVIKTEPEDTPDVPCNATPAGNDGTTRTWDSGTEQGDSFNYPHGGNDSKAKNEGSSSRPDKVAEDMDDSENIDVLIKIEAQDDCDTVPQDVEGLEGANNKQDSLPGPESQTDSNPPTEDVTSTETTAEKGPQDMVPGSESQREPTPPTEDVTSTETRDENEPEGSATSNKPPKSSTRAPDGLFIGTEIFQCEKCEQMYSSQRYLDLHIKSHTEKKKHTCDVCGNTYRYYSALVLHKRSHEEKGKPFKCGCGIEFTSKQHFERHKRAKIRPCKFSSNNSVSEPSTDTDAANQPTNRKTFSCFVCPSQFSTAFHLNRHVKEQHGQAGGFKCRYCEKTFLRSEVCRQHEQGHGVRSVQCEFCPLTFETSREAESHTTVNHTDDKPYWCTHCPEKFPSKLDKVSHEKEAHSGEAPFRCQYCMVGFSDEVTQRVHEQSHVDNKNFKCQFCERVCTTITGFKLHVKSHSVERKVFRCDVCGRECPNVSTLRNHMVIHADIAPYKCIYCDKRFNTPSNLTIHERSHRGEKPHSCRLCQRPFNRRGDLTVHERIHTGERPYPCRFCDKRFPKSHLRKVHEDKHRERNDPPRETSNTEGGSPNVSSSPSLMSAGEEHQIEPNEESTKSGREGHEMQGQRSDVSGPPLSSGEEEHQIEPNGESTESSREGDSMQVQRSDVSNTEDGRAEVTTEQPYSWSRDPNNLGSGGALFQSRADTREGVMRTNDQIQGQVDSVRGHQQSASIANPNTQQHQLPLQNGYHNFASNMLQNRLPSVSSPGPQPHQQRGQFSSDRGATPLHNREHDQEHVNFTRHHPYLPHNQSNTSNTGQHGLPMQIPYQGQSHHFWGGAYAVPNQRPIDRERLELQASLQHYRPAEPNRGDRHPSIYNQSQISFNQGLLHGLLQNPLQADSSAEFQSLQNMGRIASSTDGQQSLQHPPSLQGIQGSSHSNARLQQPHVSSVAGVFQNHVPGKQRAIPVSSESNSPAVVIKQEPTETIGEPAVALQAGPTGGSICIKSEQPENVASVSQLQECSSSSQRMNGDSLHAPQRFGNVQGRPPSYNTTVNSGQLGFGATQAFGGYPPTIAHPYHTHMGQMYHPQQQTPHQTSSIRPSFFRNDRPPVYVPSQGHPVAYGSVGPASSSQSG